MGNVTWKKRFTKGLIIAIMLVSTTTFAEMNHMNHGGNEGSGGDGLVADFAGSHPAVWHIKGERPMLIGGYGDNFSYDGSRVVPLLGSAELILDSERDSGTMVVNLQGTIYPEKDKVYSGDIKLVYTIKKGGPAFKEGGVADFVYLHGDSKQGPPVMPKTRTFLGAWGSADLYINGEIVYKGLAGHMMYTERTRDLKTQAIYNKDGSGYYSPKSPADASIVDADGRELHFVAHDMREDQGHFPPHSIMIHLNFEHAVDLSSLINKGSCNCGKCQNMSGANSCSHGCNCKN